MFAFKVKRIRTPIVLQLDELESGAVSLSIIFHYFKKYISLEELRIDCGISRDGSRLENIINVAEKYNIIAHRIKDNFENLRSLSFPCICVNNQNHFFVIEDIKDDVVYINDPAYGHKSESFEHFKKGFVGQIITFKKGPDFKPTLEPITNIGYFKKLIWRSKSAFLLCMLCGTISFIPSIMLAIFIKLFMDYYIVLKYTSFLEPILSGILFILVLNVSLRWLLNDVLLRISNKIAICESSDIIWQIFKLPFSFFLQRLSGEIAFRINLIEKISVNVSKLFTNVIVNALAVIFSSIAMLFLNFQMTFVIFLISSINVFITFKMISLRSGYNKVLIIDQSKYFALSFSAISVMQNIKGSGREREYFAYIAGAYTNLSNLVHHMESETNYLRIIPNILIGVISIIILVYGSYLVMNNSITLGTLLAMQSLSATFLVPLNGLVVNILNFQGLFEAFDKLIDIMCYKYENKTSKTNHLEQHESVDIHDFTYKGNVNIRSLSYGYNMNVKAVLNDINLTISPGERIAIVGTSGSGKSTLLKLIIQIYEPWSGDILYDGSNGNLFKKIIASNSIAMVDQEPFIFEGSVRDNISMWDKAYQEDLIIKAAKYACLHNDVIKFRYGYEQTLKEGGTNISGGQRQKIEIARALLRSPNLLMLDEATSNIDRIDENKIMSNIWKLGCTTIIVSHKLSTIKDCDRIIVLEDGRIVQDGPHEALLLVDGLYRNIVKEQFG